MRTHVISGDYDYVGQLSVVLCARMQREQKEDADQ
jgi:hypothetical protein